MGFGMTIWNKNKMMKQKFVISIQIFIAHVKANDIYKHIAKDFETRFGTLNYELNRGLTREKSKKVIGVMKD